MKRKYFGSLILSRLDTETRLGKILDRNFVQIFLQLSLFLSETEIFFFYWNMLPNYPMISK